MTGITFGLYACVSVNCCPFFLIKCDSWFGTETFYSDAVDFWTISISANFRLRKIYSIPFQIEWNVIVLPIVFRYTVFLWTFRKNWKKRKTVSTIMFHLIWKEIKIYFPAFARKDHDSQKIPPLNSSLSYYCVVRRGIRGNLNYPPPDDESR